MTALKLVQHRLAFRHNPVTTSDRYYDRLGDNRPHQWAEYRNPYPAPTPGLCSFAALSVSTKGHSSSGPLLLCHVSASDRMSPLRIGLCCGTASTRDRCASAIQRSTALATPNYGYEKRQRELAKKRKNEEKKQKKQQGPGSGGPDDGAPADGSPDYSPNINTTTPPPPAAG